MHAHQHETHGAIAANEIPSSLLERSIDDIAVDRIEDDHGILAHA